MAEVPMSEASFGSEIRPPIDAGVSQLNQEGIVVVEQPQEPGFFRSAVRKLGVPAVLATALVLSACGGGHAKTGGEVVTNTPTASAAASSATPEKGTPTVTVTATEAPKPATATATPEAKKDAPSKVFPTVNDQGERILNKQENITYIGFNFDSKVPIYAPRDGNIAVVTDEGQPFAGSSVSVYVAGAAFQVIGNIDVNPNIGSTVHAGDLLGYTRVTKGPKSLGSDVVVTAARVNAAGTGRETDMATLENLFPEAFKRPSREFTSQLAPKPGVGVVFVGPNAQ